MRIELLQGYNGFLAGRELNVGEGVARLLIQRGIAKSIEPVALSHDADSDGKDEGGEEGEKKAFSKPPKPKRR
jgi:hypothetical protein